MSSGSTPSIARREIGLEAGRRSVRGSFTVLSDGLGLDATGVAGVVCISTFISTETVPGEAGGVGSVWHATSGFCKRCRRVLTWLTMLAGGNPLSTRLRRRSELSRKTLEDEMRRADAL